MNLKTESINKNFSSFAKLLHWGFVILFLYGLLKQIDSINQLEDDNLLMFEVIFSLAFLLLLIIRFVYMKTTQQSSIPDDTPKSQ
jgi:cytochrome b561